LKFECPALGVQGCKQLVRGISPRFDQGIEQGGFACVGVAHQRHIEHLVALTLTALGLALLFHLVQTLFGALD
jgi:hypothetical protein